MSDAFSPEQRAELKAIVTEAMHDVLEDIGFKTDPQHREETQETVRWLYKLKRVWDDAVNRVGSAVMTAIIVIAFAIIGLGFWQWIGRGGQ